MISRLFVIVLCLLAFSSYGGPTLDGSLKLEIEHTFPDYEISSVAVGALTDDNSQYAVALLSRPTEDGSDHKIMKAAVFKRTEHQPYKLLAKSLGWEYYPLHRIGWYNPQIEKKLIILSVGGSTSCCSGFTTEFRFRKTNTGIPLVGVETTEYGYEGSPEEVDTYKYYEGRTSVNFLTGKIIHSKRIGKPKDNPSELGFGEKPQYIEKHLQMSKRLQLDMSNFHPDKYFDFRTRTTTSAASSTSK